MTDLFGEDPVERVLAYMDAVLPVRDREALLLDLMAVREAKPCFRNGRLEKSMHGMGALWGYFPHALDVVVNGVSVRQKLADPVVRRRIAEKTWTYCEKWERGQISFNRIRQSMKVYGGHHVSNFRPVAARDLYRQLGARAVFDPCAGWGGRLLGSCEMERYVGVDASRHTVDGHAALIEDAGFTHATVLHGAIEDFDLPSEEWADVAFTSPPYFDQERYSEDAEQSWVRYRTYPEWRDGFLFPLVAQMASQVKHGGYVVLNIADVQGLPLVQDAHDAMRGAGLTFLAEWRYILSSVAGHGEKSEPVLVYRV